MKRVVAAVSFAVLAAPVFGQPQSLGPTDPIGASSVYDFNRTADRTVVASSGATRSDSEIGTDAAETNFLSRHVERKPGYFDHGQ